MTSWPRARVEALALSVVLAGAFAPLWANEQETVISVPGIPGPYCAYGVEKRLLELGNVERVELLWRQEEIRVLLVPGKTVTVEQIETAVERADYPYEYHISIR